MENIDEPPQADFDFFSGLAGSNFDQGNENSEFANLQKLIGMRSMHQRQKNVTTNLAVLFTNKLSSDEDDVNDDDDKS